MNSKLTRRAFVTAACGVLFASDAEAAKLRPTTVYVKDMHCATCAKKIAGKLYTVPGVLKVQTNYKKGTAVVTPQKSRNPSPKALWEAVESATFEPVKIASPMGTYTRKPNR